MPWRYVGGRMYISIILDLGAEWLASRPDCFTVREWSPATHWIGKWVGPRAWTLWRREKSCHARNRTRAVQSVAHSCEGWFTGHLMTYTWQLLFRVKLDTGIVYGERLYRDCSTCNLYVADLPAFVWKKQMKPRNAMPDVAWLQISRNARSDGDTR
jgi:hypothetical protein